MEHGLHTRAGESFTAYARTYVELVFGHGKQNRGFGNFTRRGHGRRQMGPFQNDPQPVKSFSFLNQCPPVQT